MICSRVFDSINAVRLWGGDVRIRTLVKVAYIDPACFNLILKYYLMHFYIFDDYNIL